MKINTISAYVLVYLLARGHWNLMVPVRADVEGDGSSGMSSADGGSSSGTPAEGSSLATPASESGSTASADAGLTAGEGSGHVAGGSDADGSAGSSAEGASSGDGSGHVAGGSDADGSAGSPADGASSGEASTVPDEHASVVELFTGGWTVDADSISNPEFVAKREDAKRFADNARKAAQELLKKADELDKVIKDTGVLEEFNDKVDALVYNIRVDASHINSAVKPLDMSYYSGFPDGWHKRVEHEVLEKMYKERLMSDNMMYYSGFPDGWHRLDEGALQDIRRYKIKLEAVEVKAMIDAKKKEIESLNKVILDLTTQMQAIEAEVVKLEQEHKELENKLLGLDAALIKLYKADAEGNPVLMEENTDFEKKKSQGDLRFVIKDGAKCTKVMYGVHELWKKGEREVDEPKLVAFNASVGVIAVRDNDRAVLFKKETSSDKWYYHNTVLRRTAGTPSRTAAQTGSSAGSTLASSSALAGSKMNLEAGSTGTPETPESLDETASVASGEGSDANEANESESSSALRGSASSAEGGSSSGGEAASEYSSVFMD